MTTTIDRDEVERVAAKLTRAQRAALLRVDDRVYSNSELHHRTRAALFANGILGDIRAASLSFFAWTRFGLAVRQYLLEQEQQS